LPFLDLYIRTIAGMKIFRDEIYGGLKIIFRADHRNYKKTGVYDFPQKNLLNHYWSDGLIKTYLSRINVNTKRQRLNTVEREVTGYEKEHYRPV